METMDPASREDPAEQAPPPDFRTALRYWLRLGFINFGGPAGQIAIMHRDLVERRRWISEERFLHALNFCMLLPGPEAQQLATYIGWLLHGIRGGLVAGALFVLPSVFVLLGLSWVYAAHGESMRALRHSRGPETRGAGHRARRRDPHRTAGSSTRRSPPSPRPRSPRSRSGTFRFRGSSPGAALLGMAAGSLWPDFASASERRPGRRSAPTARCPGDPPRSGG